MDKMKHTIITTSIVFLFTVGIYLSASSEQTAAISGQTAVSFTGQVQFVPFEQTAVISGEQAAVGSSGEQTAALSGGQTASVSSGAITESSSLLRFETDTLGVTAAADSLTDSSPLSDSIFSASDTKLTVCWYDTVLPEEQKTKLTDCILSFRKEGYRISFFLYDLETGQGISYHSTDSYYSASTIKGPYAVCIAESYPESIAEFEFLFEDIIHVSDNYAYSCLWDLYGTEDFEVWLSEAGCEDIDASDLYTDITAQELALMWIQMYDYFISGTPESDWISNLYTDTLNSCISDALGDTYTIYSKAGWICEDEYYNVQNDAGIVLDSQNPYVIAVLSDAYERMDLLVPLVCALDDAHTCLAEN